MSGANAMDSGGDEGPASMLMRGDRARGTFRLKDGEPGVSARAKALLRPLLPRPYRHRRIRAHEARVRQRAGVPALNRAFVDRWGTEVHGGPMRGLRYPPESIESVDALVAKLVGAFEQPLHAAIEREVAREPATFVDIGAAEGYYAAGFALRCPGARVEAFEQDRRIRRHLRRIAELNGVDDRIRFHGRCTAAELQALPGLDGAFVLSDCEGAEHEIFSGEAIAALRTATVLIELHSTDPGGHEIDHLLARFSPTHDVSRIRPSAASADSFPELQSLTPEQRDLALGEFRVDRNGWAICRPTGS